MDTHPETALVPLAKDELAPDERARVDAHLAGCEACRRALADVRAVLAELAAARWRAVAPVLVGTNTAADATSASA